MKSNKKQKITEKHAANPPSKIPVPQKEATIHEMSKHRNKGRQTPPNYKAIWKKVG